MLELFNNGYAGTILCRDPQELLLIFETAQDLPTLPEVALRLQEVVDDPHSGAKDVARIIEDDPAIAAKVLRAINSVFYAPAHGVEIKQLPPAIARLGFMAVTNIALSTSVFQAFGRVQQPIFDRREFWRHSVNVGVMTAVLYDACANRMEQRITRDAAHLAGIMHDMGKILFERYAHNEFHAAIRSAKEREIDILKEERRLVGLGHDEAGAWLARKWKIDEQIRSVVRWHHEPYSCPPEHQALTKLIHIADFICHEHKLGVSGNPCPQLDSQVPEELELTVEKIDELIGIAQVEAANSEILLSLSD